MRKRFFGAFLFLLGFLVASVLRDHHPASGAHAIDDECAEVNGDADGDGTRDISDAIYLLSWLFTGGPALVPSCITASELEALQEQLADCQAELESTRNELFGCQQQCGPAKIVINEVDYDQSGVDTAEFVEIYNVSGKDFPLTGVLLIFVSGSTNQEHGRVDLSSINGGILPPGAYLVVHQAGLTIPGTALSISLDQSFLQNGAPDGVLLFDTKGMTILDALSYEGAMNAVTLNDIQGTFDLVSGNPTNVSDAGEGSLARLPNGRDTGDDSVDWFLSNIPTPGSANE